jgi:hypothetical protein
MTGPFVRVALTTDAGVSFCWVNAAHVVSIDPDPDRPDRSVLWHTPVAECAPDGTRPMVAGMIVDESADALAERLNRIIAAGDRTAVHRKAERPRSVQTPRARPLGLD